MTNLFCREPPTAYEYGGKRYEINSDFRCWIRFELLISDEDISPREKRGVLERIAFQTVPPDPKLWEFILWFYQCGKVPQKSENKGGGSKKQAAVYSFEYDDGYIFSAFLEQYGIDLTSIEYLHWWKFRSLFRGLHDCKFTDIMGYRSEKIDKDTPTYREKFLKDMKKLYALPKSISEQMRIDELKRIRDSYR